MVPSINDLYLKYIDSVGMSLEDDRYFQYLFEIVQAGDNELHQTNRILHKIIDEEWISIIEESLDSINAIIDKPRRFVTTSEEVVPVALAKKISADSVKHLSQHTEFIAQSNDGMVHPTKVLNVTTEETYDLYENRFIYHLIQRLIAFVDKRTDIIFWSTGDEKESVFTMKSTIDDAYENIEYKLEMKVKNKQSFAENDNDNMNVFMRIDRVRRLVFALKQSSFCSLMAGCQSVRSPIQRTNLMMKDPHYRKCYALWQFLERYDNIGYKIDVQESAVEFDEEYLFQMYTNLIMNYTVFKTLTEADIREIDPEPVTRHDVIAPKFIKEIKEEFVDDYNLPDVEIRRVFVDEVTQAQLDAEAALEEERAAKKALEEETHRLAVESEIIGHRLEDALAQINGLVEQKESVEKDMNKILIEMKTEEEAAAQIRFRLETSLKERSIELDNQRTANALLEKRLKESAEELASVKESASIELETAQASAEEEIASVKASAEEEMSSLRTDYEARLEAMSKEHEDTLNSYRESTRKAMLQHAEETEAALAAREQSYSDRFNEYRKEISVHVDELNQKLRKESYKADSLLRQYNTLLDESEGRESELKAMLEDRSTEIERLKKELAEMNHNAVESAKRMARIEKDKARIEKERDRARAKAEENSLSKYLIDRLSGRK